VVHWPAQTPDFTVQYGSQYGSAAKRAGWFSNFKDCQEFLGHPIQLGKSAINTGKSTKPVVRTLKPMSLVYAWHVAKYIKKNDDGKPI
jgi:hypothetical protein